MNSTTQYGHQRIAETLSGKDLRDLPIGLHAGKAGVALFLAYHARYAGDPSALDRSMEIIGDCFAGLQEEGVVYNLCSGITGPAWTLAHLVRHGFFETNVEGTLGELDDFLLDIALSDIAAGEYDLLHSGLGVGVYLLERWLGGARSPALPRLIEALAQARVADGDLRTWPDNFSLDRGDITFNLGMAHGVPSIVGFLAGCLSAGVPAAGLPELLAESTEWLLRQELPAESSACFARRVKDGRPDAPNSPLAWCYGDLGVAAALFLAAAAAQRSDWREAALRVASKSAQRPPAVAGSEDACFCHGSAGIAYIFQKFHRTTGEPLFAEAARSWYAETRRRLQASGNLFFAHTGSGMTDMSWREDVTLLDGLAGLGMALLSEESDIAEDWDRCFVLS